MEFNQTLSIIGGIVTGLAVSFGVGQLLLAIYQRWAGRKDKREAMNDSNRGAELEYDGKFQERLLARVDTLEHEIRDMQHQQVAAAHQQAKLEIENTNLRHENQRQKVEIGLLQQQDAARLERIRHLEAQVEELTASVELLTQNSLLKAHDLQTLADSAAIIQNAISRLGFVPTGDPTEADDAAVQRLKEIRDASAKIREVVSGK